ncbi:ComEC/Rec2 family competence protein [Amnibacterium flavum]|uniref:Competence protein ComEC n=1 Tax=Amnibacterium flavum TaxID=2173173 RepID=A0A2V1HUX1_9MICO|nr:ComEC/Rec2 family competence protein [Amnibacterium flavum]PVZ94097.1 competence protein ComEC [Amnibacterium flavum]
MTPSPLRTTGWSAASDTRAVGAATGAWVTAFAATGVSDLAAGPVAAWVVVVGVAAATVALRSRRIGPALAAATVLLAVCALLLTATAAGLERRSPTALGLDPGATSAASMTGTVELTGTVERPEAGAFGSPRVAGTLVGIRIDGRERAASVPVLLFSDDVVLESGIGARVEVRGSVRRADPGDSVAWLVFARDAEYGSGPTGPVAWASGLRDGFLAWSSELPGDGGLLLPGLAIGDTRAVTPSLDAAMTAGSLSHLTAVSGANCAVVVAGVMALAAALGLRLRSRVVLAGAALVGFVLIVTPQPSVLRAAAMAVILLVATVSGRRGAGLPALMVTVVVLLSLDPWLARDFGFALSVAATAGLLTLAPALTRALSRGMSPVLAAAIAVPTAAQAACQPVLVLLDPTLPVLSVPANLLAAPAAPIATVAGLLASLLLPVLPPVGAAVGWLAWIPSSWIAAVARAFDQVPARLPWLPGAVGAALAALVLLLVVVAVRRRSRVVAVLAVGVAASVVASLIGISLGSALSRPADWWVVSCDVGQGAAALIRGDDSVALIDTGDDPAALERCLAGAGVQRIHLLVLTHFDRDHVGAAGVLAGRVDSVLVGPSDGPVADRLVETLRRSGAEVHETVAGESGMLGDLDWRVVWPEPGAPPGNDASVVLAVQGDGVSAAVLGDLGEEAQRALLRSGRLGRVDVVSVAHHGSADQSPELYERLGARVALVSVGADNPYGHPTASALEMLDALGATTLRTDRSGTAVLALVGEEHRLVAWSAGGRTAADPGEGVGGSP